MSIVAALRTWPASLRAPLCRYFCVTDRILAGLFSKIENQLDMMAALDSEEAKKAKKILSNKMLVINGVRSLVAPTDDVRDFWEAEGAAFDRKTKKPGEGAKFLEDFVLYSRKRKARDEQADDLVMHYTMVVCFCLRGFGREEIFHLHLPESLQRDFTYLSLVIDRLQMALKDLEDTSLVVRDYYPEDDSPLDVGQYGFDIRDYAEVRDAAARLDKAETALLAMIVRQYRRRFEERYPDITVFQYAVRRMGSEGIVDVSMKAVPVICQLAEDIAPDIPEGEELRFLLKEGFVEPILNFRSQSTLRYATTQAWPLASYLRIVNLHLLFILDEKRELSATEFLDFIYNDSIDEETIRRNLSKEHGLATSVTENLNALCQWAPRPFVRALAASFATVLPVLDALANDPASNLTVRFKGTPVEHFDDEGVRQLFEGVAAFGREWLETCPREKFDPEDREGLLAVVAKATESVNASIAETCDKLSEHDAREAFRALVAFWSVAVVLMRGTLAKGEVPEGVDREAFDTNFRFIIVGVSDLIRRFNIIDLPDHEGESGRGTASSEADGSGHEGRGGEGSEGGDMPPPSMLN